MGQQGPWPLAPGWSRPSCLIVVVEPGTISSPLSEGNYRARRVPTAQHREKPSGGIEGFQLGATWWPQNRKHLVFTIKLIQETK